MITASLGGRLALDNFSAYCMSKSAIISFSDVLRREMRKFNVKVSTIEPGLFKTAMFYTTETVFQNSWKETDPDIKQLYGEQYFREQLEIIKTGKNLFLATDDLDIVVNDMIDAIESGNPKLSYKQAPFIYKLAHLSFANHSTICH